MAGKKSATANANPTPKTASTKGHSTQATGGSSTGKARFTAIAQGVIDKNAARPAASKGAKAK